MRANAFSECQENQGVIDYWHAEYAELAGQDARPLIERAERNLTQAGALQQDFLENRQFTAALRLLQVRETARRLQDDPRRADEVAARLAAFDLVLAQCFQLSEKDPMCSLLDARRALVVADLEAQAGPVRPVTLAVARERAARAVEANPPDADAHEVLARAELRLASAPSAPTARAAHRDAGLGACAAGLAINPTHHGLLAAREALGKVK
jgi:hypothetical protein